MARVAKRYLAVQEQSVEAKKTVIRVGIYSRLSVDNDERKGESIENQIELINQYIIANNKKPDRDVEYVIYDTYIDRGKSGTTFKREGFERLMQDVRMKNIECIMVKDFSRFGRDYIETGNYIEKILPFMGVRFISVADNFDSMSENAGNEKLAMNIKNLVNDMYAKDISKRIVMCRKNAMENGEYIGTTPPYGYHVERINGKRTLVVDREAAVIVRLIFELYASGMKVVDISKFLYEKKVHRVKDYRIYKTVYCQNNHTLYQWTDSSLYTMLKNEAYVGDLVQGKTYKRAYTGNSKVKYAPKEEWVTVKNTHEAIIDRLLFPEQREIELKTEVQKEIQNEVFRNKVYCGDCGKKLKTSSYETKKITGMQCGYYCRWAYYVDERRCTKKYISEQQLETLVLTAIQNEFGHLKLKAKDITQINKSVMDEKQQFYFHEIHTLKKRIGVEQHKLSMLYMTYKAGEITKKAYEENRKQLIDDEKFMNSLIADLEKKIVKLEKRTEEENKFLRSLFKVKKLRINTELVDALVDKIEVHSIGKVVIHFKFKGEDFHAK